MLWYHAQASKSPRVSLSNVLGTGHTEKVSGTPKDYDAVGASGKVNKHWFCSNCGSSLYTELEVMPDMTW